MGLSKCSYKSPPPSAIIIRQWDGESGAGPPLFWALEPLPKDTNHAATIPAQPVLVPKTFKRKRPQQLGKGQSAQHLPPLLAYENSSHHIFEHRLRVVDGHVDVEINRWGPGVRLAQTQRTTEIFDRPPAGMSHGEGSNVSLPAVALTGRIRARDDHSYSPCQLYAVARDNCNGDDDGDGDGSLEIKYLVKKTPVRKEPGCTTSETLASYEQTVRLADDTEALPISPLGGTVHFHVFTVGRQVEYLVFSTLRPGTASAPSILSLYSVDQSLAIADADAMTAPNQDHGLRWQLQTMELPGNITKTAPIVLTVDNVQFLFLFYFGSDGEMRHTSLRYAGSGRWEGPVHGIPCRIAAPAKPQAPPRATPAQAATATAASSRSRFSLSSYVSFSSSAANYDSEQAKEKREQAAPEQTTPRQEPALARPGAQPYVVNADRTIYVFFEGADGNGRYLSHDIPYDANGFRDGWMLMSWKVPSPEETDGQRAERHFIPVVVKHDFMALP